MKLFKKIRKGFTLIELVVVIAVIAILSAVAVVSYISITNKAKRSSDEQAVAQMNTILKANDIMGLNSIKDVFAAFDESGLDAKNYKPLSKDTYFFWDADANKIIYVDKNYTVLYPNELKGQTKGADSHWLSLSGEIATRDYSEDKTATGVKVSGTPTEAGEKLYKLSEDIKNNEYKVSGESASNPTTIELPEKVDLAGSEFNLGAAQNVTVKGESKDKPTTIDNVFTSEYQSKGTSENRKDRSYQAGMVHSVEGVVKFQNLVIKNVTIGDYGISMTGIFAGEVKKNGQLIIENCQIENAYIYGEQKVGAIVGYISGSTANTKVQLINCSFKDVHILSEEGCAGGITGLKTAVSTIVCDADSANSIKTNVSLSLNKVADRHYHTVPAMEDAQNEVASTFESYATRKAESRKNSIESTDAKERCKPGCATFAWINNTGAAADAATKTAEDNYNKTAEVKVEHGQYFDDFMVAYKLLPVHLADMGL